MRVRRVAKHIFKYHAKHGMESNQDKDYFLAEDYLRAWGEYADEARAWYRRKLRFWQEADLINVWLDRVIYGNERVRPHGLIERLSEGIVGRIKWLMSRRGWK